MMDKCFDEGTLQAFLDNELSQELSQSVARHLVDCDPCAIMLAEVEEETAFAFAALEQEFNTLVPTQRLWTKINDSIEIQHRKRSFWQYILGLVSGFSLTNPHVIAFGSLLLIVGVVSVLIVVKNDYTSKDVADANKKVPNIQNSSTTAQVDNAKVDVPPAETPVKANNSRPKTTPEYRIDNAKFVEPNRRSAEKNPTPKNDFQPQPQPAAPQFLAGEENYVNTIAKLEQTVDQNKDEVLKPSARFSYEKDLAVVNDTINKMKKEVKKNPKNQDAKQILFSSYQNKIELLNSVTQRGELMASLSR